MDDTRLEQIKEFGSGSNMKADSAENNSDVESEQTPNRELPENSSLITKTVLKGLLGTGGLHKDKDLIKGELHE